MTNTFQAIEDPVFPRMADALNEHAMRDVFGDAIRAFGGVITDCSVERVKYRPRRNCSISYRLTWREPATGEFREQRVAARVCGGDEASQRAGRVRSDDLQPSPAGPSVQLVAELGVLAWWWPNDAKLTAPKILSDAACMREAVLPDVVAALSAGRGRLSDYRLDVVQYVPEDRVCARVEVRWREDGGTREALLYVKSSREPDTATAFDMLRDLHEATARMDGRLVTPRPILHQPHLQLHWQEAVPGRALLDCERPQRVRLAAALGERLAVLHATQIRTVRRADAASLRQRLTESTYALSLLQADLAKDIRDTAEQLESGIERVARGAQVTLHGDLHARNVLVEGDVVALIDLDGARTGHPVLDIGAWIADSMYYALLEGLAPSVDRAAWRHVLHGYESGGAQRPDPEMLAWSTAWHLFCQRARRCVCNLKPGRPEIAPRLVRLAGKIVQARTLECV